MQMTIGMRRLVVVACMALLAVGITDRAYGFFPKGGFNLSWQLRYAIWPFREFDTNNNGVIEPGEGLEFRIEGGPRGFTNFEIDQVKAGFKAWQDVPTSYASFRFTGIIDDPIIPGIGAPDFLPMVFMQVTDVAPDDGYSQIDEFTVPQLVWPLPAVTLVLYTIDTAPVPVDNRIVVVPAGTILDCDIIVDASMHRTGVMPNNTFGTLDLQATITHQVGHLLGLAPTPLNNLDPFNEVTLEEGTQGLPVEPAVIQLTGTDGVPRRVGATPVMFPLYFLTEQTSGEYVAGWRDLAPDDISGVSWLYPREDGLENFFTIKQEARTHVRAATGIPSSPISGGHVVAWANVTGSDSDRRVPLFSTMTGLYHKYTDVQLSGRFHLMGLWKQMEVPGRDRELFEPSYVLTLNPLNGLGYDRQAPPNFTPAQFDSIQGPLPISYSVTVQRPPSAFSTNYPSEVFNEHGTVYGIDNNAAGTPLAWSFRKNTVVSVETNRTLPRMLPRNEPMFGDADAVCPMNIIENIGAGGTPTGNIVVARLNNKLRGFRDDTLLRSVIGTAVVDMYYRAAPYMGYYLMRNERARDLARAVILFGLWTGERLMNIAAAVLVIGLMWLLARKRQFARKAGVAIVLATVCLWATGAYAGQLPITTEDLVAESSYIVSGKVLSAEGRQDSNGRIYTDVVFEVHDVAKGAINRGSTITFSVIGGRVGPLVLAATGIPSFVEDEHALLHLLDLPDYGLVPIGGYRSKVVIFVDPETEEEEVVVGEEAPDNEGELEEELDDEEGEPLENDEGESAEKSALRPMPAAARYEARAGRMPVRDYMRYLRAIANSQR